MEERKRLPIETFDIPVQDIRRGYYSAVYFWREKQILEKRKYDKEVIMQVFQKNNAVLCGIDEAIAVLKLCSGHYSEPKLAFYLFDQYKKQERLIRELQVRRDFPGLEATLKERIRSEVALDNLWVDKSSELKIMALNDCDRISPWETVMTIKGLPQHFAHLESVYLGILARRTLVATNVADVVEAAQGKPILFFADRFDHYRNQTGDGYAAMCGGVKGVATDNMGEWWGNQGSGTMPHALIACFYGDTVRATLEFAKQYPEVPCISLVDFQNNCANTAVDVANAFRSEGLKLWGVRLDTSENMVDASIYRQGQMGSERPTGVNPLLVNNVRRALDRDRHGDVKIIVSGGFNRDKIRYFESEKVPVDAYGCGSSLLKGSNDFTADIVIVDGRYCGKVGRWERPNTRLQLA
jgi:nicotinate phosphoribosyltransferase